MIVVHLFLIDFVFFTIFQSGWKIKKWSRRCRIIDFNEYFNISYISLSSTTTICHHIYYYPFSRRGVKNMKNWKNKRKRCTAKIFNFTWWC